MEFLDKHCMVENQKAMLRKSDCEETFVSAFDFLYLPMDFGYVSSLNASSFIHLFFRFSDIILVSFGFKSVFNYIQTN